MIFFSQKLQEPTMKKYPILLAFFPLLYGCATPSTAKIDATPLTFEKAMQDLIAGLKVFSDTAKQTGKDEKIGLVPSKITLDFNIGATQNSAGETKLGVSAPSIIEGLGITAGGRHYDSLNTNNSNHITIEFENIELHKYKAELELQKTLKSRQSSSTPTKK